MGAKNERSPSREMGDSTMPPVPTEHDQAASNAFRETFRRLLEENDELLRVGKRAREVLACTPLQRFEGLSHLVDEVLPHQEQRIRRLARVLKLHHDVIAGFRASTLDPIHLPVAPLTDLARMMKLDFTAFTELLARDHARFSTRSVQVLARGVRGPDTATDEFEQAVDAFRAAWNRAELDDPA
jgi:hypothetical protein